MDPPNETKVANAPFDTDFADAILRTSDKVDFYVHSQILRLASTVFDGMFTTPQPPAETGATQIGSSRPTIDLTEDSVTIEHLLRYYYPVIDPVIEDLGVLDRVLTAADKYDMKMVDTVATRTLARFIKSKPLAAYAVACLHNCEDIAKEAADAWKRTKLSWLDKVERFEDTPAGASYADSMIQRLSAGPYYRLIRYLRGQLVNSFSGQNADPWQASSEMLLTEVLSRYPFNCTDADITLRSMEGHDFRVHRIVIELQFRSGPNSAENLPTVWSQFQRSPDDVVKDGCPVVETKLPWDVLARLLELCYPACGDDHVSNWDIKKFTSFTSLGAARAATRYGFQPALQTYLTQLRQFIQYDPLAAYCVAVHLGLTAEAREAAQKLAACPSSALYSSDVESLSSRDYHALLKCYHQSQIDVYRIIVRRGPFSGFSTFLGQNMTTFTYEGKAMAKISIAQLLEEIKDVLKSPLTGYTYEFGKIVRRNEEKEQQIMLAWKVTAVSSHSLVDTSS